MTTTPLLDGLETLRPGDERYDATRAVWNAMVDRRPRLIVRCRTAADVQAAVRTARELDLEIGVRCGGHSTVGHAVPDDGMMIDLTPMGEARVDPAARRARVQGGALLGALDRASQRHGLATTAGNVSHTGVGGLTLGGGMGWLARQLGLACDNVTSYDVVTAEGELVTATATEHPDLFWGLRGGGGNFGIVTDFEFVLHEVGTSALVAEFGFDPADAMAVLRGWRDLAAEAPRQATYGASVGPGGITTVAFIWVGPPEQGHRLVPALRSLGRPVTENVREMSYVELQTREDDTVAQHTWRRYLKGHYLPALPDEALEAFVHRGAPDGPGEIMPNAGLTAYGGAIAEVGEEDTAFSHRQTLFEWGAGARWSDPDEDAERLSTARRAAAAMQPYATGVYVNMLSDEGAEGVRRAYSDAKLARLTAVKDRYDPDNVFHLNQNITPTPRA
jgi:FAD/FMN-containing dehydrogenase